MNMTIILVQIVRPNEINSWRSFLLILGKHAYISIYLVLFTALNVNWQNIVNAEICEKH